jgi:hypothetical protein
VDKKDEMAWKIALKETIDEGESTNARCHAMPQQAARASCHPHTAGTELPHSCCRPQLSLSASVFRASFLLDGFDLDR